MTTLRIEEGGQAVQIDEGGNTISIGTEQVTLNIDSIMGGNGVVLYDTEAELLAATLSDGTIAYARDTERYWFMNNGSLAVGNITLTGDINLGIGQKLILDDDGTSYVVCSENDLIKFCTNDIERFVLSNSGAQVVTGDFRLPASNTIVWHGLTKMTTGGVSGNLLVTDSGGADFGLLQFGGTTAAYPALKRDGALLEVRLSDDSDYASLWVKTLFASANVYATNSVAAGTTGRFSWGSRSLMYSDVDGDIRLVDSTLADFGLLQFGGTTSAYPALKRVGNDFQIRVADDSGYTNLTVASLIAANNVRAGAAGFFYFDSRTKISGNIDGNLLVTDDDGNDFGMLQFGGDTSAYVALRRNGTTLELVKGDGTDGAALDVSGVLSAGGVADTEQLVIRAAAAQTNEHPLIELRDSIGTPLVSLHSDNPDNVFIGVGAGRFNDAGSGGLRNVFLGNNAGASNTTGEKNFALGSGALLQNTSGSNNIAIGRSALQQSETGINNICIGSAAGLGSAGSSFSYNLFVGALSGQNTTTGTYNVGLGGSTLSRNLTGQRNVFVGYNAGAGALNQSHSYNTGVGYKAGNAISVGSKNALFGYNAGLRLTTGDGNVLLGYNTGDSLTTGASNIILGFGINASAVDASNELNIGDLITGELVAKTVNIDGTVSLGAGTKWSSPVDGNLLMTDAAGNDFGLLQFGGTTSAYVALRRNGTALELVKGDGSDGANLIIMGTGFGIGFNGSITYEKIEAYDSGIRLYSGKTLRIQQRRNNASVGVAGAMLSITNSNNTKATASSGTQYGIYLQPDLGQTGDAAFTAVYVDVNDITSGSVQDYLAMFKWAGVPKFSVTDEGVVETPAQLLTPLGGVAISYVNDTGAASVKGTLVDASTAVDDAVSIEGTGGVDVIGVIYEDGVADGQRVWVVISGKAEVLLEDGTASTRGNWVRSSITAAGRADATLPAPPGSFLNHFAEIGHCSQSQGSGTDVLALVTLHFN